jgi:hypothetical protein
MQLKMLILRIARLKLRLRLRKIPGTFRIFSINLNLNLVIDYF